MAILLGLGVADYSTLAQEEMEVALTSATDYAKVAGQISSQEIAKTIETLSSFGSRVTGYPGCDRTAEYVEQAFRDAGLEPRWKSSP